MDAARGLAGELNLAGPWVVGRGHLPTDSPNLLGFLGLVVLWAASAAVAVRRRYHDLVRLHALLAGTCLIGLLAVARITGTMFDYLLRWVWVVTALIVTASLTTLLRWFLAARGTQPAGRGSARSPLGLVVAAALGAALVVTALAVPKFAAADAARAA